MIILSHACNALKARKFVSNLQFEFSLRVGNSVELMFHLQTVQMYQTVRITAKS